MIARGTLERDLYIYHYCLEREQAGTSYGAFASLGRQHKVTRERIRQIFRRMQKLMEG